MKTVSLSGSLRESVGKKDAKKHRKEGRVPAVIYGGKEQKQFTLENKELVKTIWNPDVFVYNLTIDGKEHQAIVQDIQFHPVTDKILHIDFLEVFEDKPFTVTIPVKALGSAPGLMKGGKLYMNRRKLQLKGLLNDIPATIDLDVSKMDVNDVIKVNEVGNEKLTFLDPQNSVVIAIKSARAMAAMGADMEIEEEEEEEGAEGEEATAEGEESGAEGEEGSEEQKSEE
jgi:large subunit ribosomal protein L25